MASAVLGLELRSGESGLRFHDAKTGRDLLTRAETEAAQEQAERARELAEEARQRAEQEREQEKRAREAAQARVAELEAVLRRERGRDS